MTKLSYAAQTAMVNSDLRTGRLPRSTTDAVRDELKAAGMVVTVGLTGRGRVVRERLIEKEMNF